MIGELKDLLDLIKEFLTGIGLENWLVQAIIVGLIGFVLLAIASYYLYRAINWLLFLRTKRFLQRDLHPFFTRFEIDKAVRYYIPSKYQDTPPSQGEEPGRKFIDSPKSRLIPMFLNTAFMRDDNRFYLILADAGMGKTTFMINLYLAYKRQWNWGRPKYEIRLLPLGNPRTIEEITTIENQENTILLLDALDEDQEAMNDYEIRLTEILDKVWRFREVIITCRTQFFPSRAEEPHETGFFKHGTDGGEFYFRKAYVSVFSDWDIKRYLLKRFNLINPLHWRKIYKALQVVRKSPNLMLRPMLLYHIKDLVESDRTYDYSYQIYEDLIDKWLDREAAKPGIKKKYGSLEAFKEKLLNLSQQLAINLYQKREDRGGYFIHKDEPVPGADLQLEDIEADLEKIPLKASEWRSRSLLNRDVDGNYKFSHKSVMEYFLAKAAINDSEFSADLKLSGLDAASRFLLDMTFEQEIWEWKQKDTKMTRKELFRSVLKDWSVGHIAWNNLGNDYYDKEDFTKALECYQKALSINKNYHHSWNNLGNVYRDLEQSEKSVECYEKCLSIKKDYYHAWNGLGMVYRDLGQGEKSVECYEKCLSIKKDYYHAWNNLGNVYSDLGQSEKSVECYEKCLLIKKDYYHAWNGLGMVYRDLGQGEKSVECYEKCLSIKKDYYHAWNNLGNVYSDLGQSEKSVECYEKCLSIKKDYYHAWNGLGMVYRDLGQGEKSVECYEKCLSIKEDYHYAWNNLGNVYRDLGQGEKSVECYEKCLSIKEDYHYAWNNLGFIFLKKKKYSLAKEHLQKAEKLAEDKSSYVYQNLGHLSLIEGDQETASELYLKGLKLHIHPINISRYIKEMWKDYDLLDLEGNGISKESYSKIVNRLEAKAGIAIKPVPSDSDKKV